MNELEKELPDKDLEGQQITVSQFTMDIPAGQEVNEDFVAEVRNKLKSAFFLYSRKKSRWYSLYNEIKTLITEVPKDLDLKELKSLKNDRTIEEMKLVPRANKSEVIAFFRFLSVLSVLVSIFVLITQALALIKPDYSPLNIVSLVVTQLYIIARYQKPSKHYPQYIFDYVLRGKLDYGLLLYYIQLKVFGFPLARPKSHRLRLVYISHNHVFQDYSKLS
jgi:hypothetical protein